MSYLGNIFIDYALRQTATPTPPDNWLALMNENGEVVGNGYARVNVAGNFAPASANDTTYNLARIDFPTPTGPWGTISSAVLYDAETGGNVLMAATLATPINVPASTPVYYEPGALQLEVVVKVA